MKELTYTQIEIEWMKEILREKEKKIRELQEEIRKLKAQIKVLINE